MAASLTAPSPANIWQGDPLASGNYFWVSSNESGRADDVQHGRLPQTPFATLAYALSNCTPDIGDVIYVMEGHVETIASAGGLTLNVPGVKIIGLGVGENRPLLRLTGSTTASIAVSNSDMHLENVVIDATLVDGITNVLTVNDEDFTLVNCDFYLADVLGQAALGIVTTVNANRLRLKDCRFWGSAHAGSDAFVKLVGTCDGVTIDHCLFIGQCAEALVWNDTGNVATNLLIDDCTFRALGGMAGIKLESAVTGVIRDTVLSGTVIASLYDPGSCASANVQGYDETVTDGQAVPLPVVGTPLTAGRSIHDELLGASINAGRLNSFVVTADFASATWNTVAAHAVVVVTGLARVRIVPVCTEALLSGGAPTIQFGEAGETNSIILSTDPLAIDTDELWLGITPKKGDMYLALLDRLVNNTTLGYEIFVAALTDGTLQFHIWWEGLSDGATVTAGTGATF